MEPMCPKHADKQAKYICKKCGLICDQEIDEHKDHMLIVISPAYTNYYMLNEKLNVLTFKNDYYQAIKQAIMRSINGSLIKINMLKAKAKEELLANRSRIKNIPENFMPGMSSYMLKYDKEYLKGKTQALTLHFRNFMRIADSIGDGKYAVNNDATQANKDDKYKQLKNKLRSIVDKNVAGKILLTKDIINYLNSKDTKDIKKLCDYTLKLSKLYWKMQLANDSITCSNDAIQYCKMQYGNMHPKLGDCYFNIATTYHNMGQSELANENYNNALKIVLQGPNDISTLQASSIYYNMGLLYENKLNSSESLKFYELAYKNSNAQDYYVLANILFHMGCTYAITQQLEQAARKFLEYLQHMVNLYGNNHPSTGDAYCNVASYYCSINMVEKGVENYLTAAQIFVGVKNKSKLIGAMERCMLACKDMTDLFETCRQIYYKHLSQLIGLHNETRLLPKKSNMKKGDN